MKYSEETAVELKNILGTLEADKAFRTFIKAVKTAGLENVLTGETKVTVFAPTEKAFDKLSRDKRSALFKNDRRLARILAYHIVPGRLILKDVMDLGSAATVEGGTLVIAPCDGVQVNEAQIIKADIECTNGMVHGIDTVLFPGRM